MAPLGAAFASGAMMLTLVGAALANAVASVLGGGRLVSGPRASLALLTAGWLWARRQRAGHSSTWDDGQRQLLACNWAVGGAVALGAVLLGLGPAVLLGAGFAVLLFVRANMRDVVRRNVSGSQRRSLKTRPPAVSERLLVEGDRIAVIELEGALFFGTADALRERLQGLPPRVETAVLGLHQVQEIDMTGARILFETAEDWRRAGRHLVFTEWTASDLRRKTVEAAAGVAAASTLHFVDTTDLAMEHLEDALIARLALGTDDERVLDLADTMIAQGLAPAVQALRLSVEAFDRLKQLHPVLAAKVLNNIALHLAVRVRSLTSDLAHWVTRSATAKATGVGVLPGTAATAARESAD